MKKTSADWQKICAIEVLDPDGWDRKNFDYSWHKEWITRGEFERRLGHSTVQGDVLGILWKDDEAYWRKNVKYLYRYDMQTWSENGYVTVKLGLDKFRVIKQTPCGIWIRVPWRDEWKEVNGRFQRVEGRRWINLNAVKQYAWKTKEEALESFELRKEAHLRHLKNKINNIKKALYKVEEERAKLILERRKDD